jgi:periplasmic protein TonB
MSDFGSLAECMVDSDAGARIRAKRLRRKALAISLIFEVGLICGVVVWPLLTVAVLPSQAVVTPLPPFHGMRQPQTAEPPNGGPRRPTATISILLQPPMIPQRIVASADPNPEPPGIGVAPGASEPGIPEGFSDGRPLDIARPPQPPVQTRTVVRNASVMEAMLVHRVEPVYPWLAKNIHLSGTVILRARIGTDGEVHELEIVSGNQILADAARQAVMQWRYRPTMLNGQAVEVETQITVNFVLNRE